VLFLLLFLLTTAFQAPSSQADAPLSGEKKPRPAQTKSAFELFFADFKKGPQDLPPPEGGDELKGEDKKKALRVAAKAKWEAMPVEEREPFEALAKEARDRAIAERDAAHQEGAAEEALRCF
jgi:hypothetical protein